MIIGKFEIQKVCPDRHDREKKNRAVITHTVT